jgi:hypothetical protein
MDGTLIVNLLKVAAALCPQIRVGGQVIDFAAPSNRLLYRSPITNVGANEFDALKRQMGDPCLRVLENADASALLEQAANEVAADESGASSDEHEITIVRHAVRLQNLPRCRSFVGKTSRHVVHQPVITVSMNSSGRRSSRISRTSR